MATETDLTADLFARLQRRSVRDERSGCLLWMGGHTKGNYGIIKAQSGSRKDTTVHKAAWTAVNGPVPDGLILDHLCHSFDESCPGGVACMHRRCWNETHIEPATPKENSNRGRPPVNKGPSYQSLKTHCPQNHAYDGANTRLGERGHRACRACDAERHRRKRQ